MSLITRLLDKQIRKTLDNIKLEEQDKKLLNPTIPDAEAEFRLNIAHILGITESLMGRVAKLESELNSSVNHNEGSLLALEGRIENLENLDNLKMEPIKDEKELQRRIDMEAQKLKDCFVKTQNKIKLLRTNSNCRVVIGDGSFYLKDIIDELALEAK